MIFMKHALSTHGQYPLVVRWSYQNILINDRVNNSTLTTSVEVCDSPRGFRQNIPLQRRSHKHVIIYLVLEAVQYCNDRFKYNMMMIRAINTEIVSSNHNASLQIAMKYDWTSINYCVVQSLSQAVFSTRLTHFSYAIRSSCARTNPLVWEKHEESKERYRYNIFGVGPKTLMWCWPKTFNHISDKK